LFPQHALGTWPAESPNLDLLQGVRTHDFSLVEWALKNGADVNYHGQFDVGVLGFLVDKRADAIQQHRGAEFDDETVRLLDLLLAHGASPSIATANGAKAIDFLNGKAAPRPSGSKTVGCWLEQRLWVTAYMSVSFLVNLISSRKR